MPRFARMIADGMRERGHEIEEWPCPVILGNKVQPPFLAKWLGYIDQFLLFPRYLRKRLKSEPQDTLFVITDQALGPWVPLVADRKHVIHCHDFLAQRSALGEFPENPTGLTGKLYQAYIRRGYRKGRNFISVSKKTQEDLHRFLTTKPEMSEVVYNGLNYQFSPLPVDEAMSMLADFPAFQEIFSHGEGQESERQQTNNRSTDACAVTDKSNPRFILHLGAGQWYKNREGVILIYRQYCIAESNPIPLVIIGRAPSSYIQALTNNLPHGGRVYFVADATNEQVHAAYALAQVFLFPSLEEGFGWPIAEAMACGCPVITTDQAPMTEVGGDAPIYIPRKPSRVDADTWAKKCSNTLKGVLDLPSSLRHVQAEKGFNNASRFDVKMTIDAYEAAYRKSGSSLALVKQRLPPSKSYR